MDKAIADEQRDTRGMNRKKPKPETLMCPMNLVLVLLIAVLKHHDQSNLQNRPFNQVYGSRRRMVVELSKGWWQK